MVVVAKNLIEATFIQRENRFVGLFEVDGIIERCHILNPGRMVTFLLPGATIYVENRESPMRKLKYSLVYVKQNNILILIDSILSNKIIKEALYNHEIKYFKDIKIIKAEQRYGIKNKSRIDFLLDNHIYLEVKSTNYNYDDIGYFPDAPSIRAQKHIKELIEVITSDTNVYEKSLKKQAYILFLSQRIDINEVRPFDSIDPEFGRLLRLGDKKGIQLIAYNVKFSDNGLKASLGKEIPVNLP